MPLAPPDPLFVFHEGMESVFCLLFVVNDYEELIYAGTGDGEVHIWNLALNRRQNTIKIGENSCLQLHRTKEELFITQEKSGPTTVWLENVEDDHSRHWTRQLVISSSYAGFCRSVLLPWENWLVLPCGGSTLRVCCLPDYKSDQGNKWREQLTSVRSKSGDTIQASCSKLKGSENDTEEIQRCKNDTEDTQRCKIDAGETQCCKNDTNDTQRCKNDTEDTQRCKNDIEQLCKNDTEQHCELEDGCKTGNNSENKSNGTDKSPTKQLPSLHELEESLEKVETFRERYIRCENSETCGEVMALKIIFEYDVLLILYESGHLKLWCLRNEKCWSTLNLFQKTQDIGSHCPMAVDFVKKYGIVVGSSNDLFVFELERAAYIEYNRLVLHYAKLVKSRTLTMTNPGASCVKIREDGEYFMVGCWDGRIRVFSGQSFQLIVVLDGHRFSSPVQDIVFASKSMDSWPGENVSASAGMDGRLCLWKSLY